MLQDTHCLDPDTVARQRCTPGLRSCGRAGWASHQGTALPSTDDGREGGHRMNGERRTLPRSLGASPPGTA